MRPLLLFLFLFPALVFAQLQFHFSIEASANFLPSTPAGKPAESTGLFIGGLAAGAELWFPGKKKNYPFAFYVQQGLISSSQLQAEFSGAAVGATPDNGRKVFTNVRLQKFYYHQLGGLAKVLRFDVSKYETALLVGAGIRFIHGEKIHVGSGEFGRGSDRLQVVTDGYEIDRLGIRPSTDIESGILLKERMLASVVPFTEAGIDVKTPEGISYFLLLQFSLKTVVDPGFYQDRLNDNHSWVQLRVGARGRIF